MAAVTMKNGIPLNLFDDGDDYEIAEEHPAEAMEPGPGVTFAQEEPGPSDRQTVQQSDRPAVGPSDRQTVPTPDRQAVPSSDGQTADGPTVRPSEQPTTPEQWSAIARENAELRERWARLESRQQLINQALAQQQAAEQQQAAAQQQAAVQQAILAQRPDPAIDPQGAELFDLRFRQAQLEQYLAQQQAVSQQAYQQQAMTQEQTQRMNWLNTDFLYSQQRHPDFQQAIGHLIAYRQQQLLTVGYPPAKVKEIIESEAVAYIDPLRMSGRSAGEFFYNWAHQVGYQRQGQPPAAVAQPNGNGVPPRIAQQQRGQALQGMGYTVPGATPDRLPSMMDIANMTDEEFNRWRAQVGPGRADFLIQQLELAEG